MEFLKIPNLPCVYLRYRSKNNLLFQVVYQKYNQAIPNQKADK